MNRCLLCKFWGDCLDKPVWGACQEIPVVISFHIGPIHLPVRLKKKMLTRFDFGCVGFEIKEDYAERSFSPKTSPRA